MKKRSGRNFAAPLAGMLMLCALMGRAQAADKPFFPLMAWDDVRSVDTIKKMADCGINVVAFVPARLLDACQANGVKAIVFDPRVSPRWDKPFDAKAADAALPEIIKQVNDKPAVYGYHLRDEPGGDQFDALGKSADLVRKLAPGKWPYINLTPGMGEAYIKDYVAPFIAKCKPPILSYDNYPIGEKGTFSYGYWATMWDIRQCALEHHLPFHVIVLSCGHWNYRIPTMDDLRLEVYGALAYGARGIAYYKFCSEPLSIMDAPDLGNFRGGPLDQFGEKTQNWFHLRNLNHQVRNLAPWLLKLHSDEVYHIGEIPKENHGIDDKSLVSGLESGTSFIIGDFTNEDGSRWVMIVNKDLHESAFCRPKFRKPVKKIEYVSPFTGELRPFPTPWYALAPGQGVLLKLSY